MKIYKCNIYMYTSVLIILASIYIMPVSTYGNKFLSKNESIHFQSNTLDVVIASPDAGMGFLSIKNRYKNTEFLHHPTEPAKALIWKIRLTDNLRKKSHLITIDNL